MFGALLHGLHLAGHGLDGDHIDAALIGALMHDVGYLMSDEEASGTGAQFTASHVMRGVEFTRRHLADLPADLLETTTKVIMLTDHRKRPDWVTFDNLQQQRAAYATATADLIGQMANREYLERVLLLYFEFVEARMGGFADIHDLLAGKDLQEGGTWMGINKQGQFAALTNYRDLANINDKAPSRGHIVKRYLNGELPDEEMFRFLKTQGKLYNGFNIIYGTVDMLYYYSNVTDQVLNLYPGIYGLSNT